MSIWPLKRVSFLWAQFVLKFDETYMILYHMRALILKFIFFGFFGFDVVRLRVRSKLTAKFGRKKVGVLQESLKNKRIKLWSYWNNRLFVSDNPSDGRIRWLIPLISLQNEVWSLKALSLDFWKLFKTFWLRSTPLGTSRNAERNFPNSVATMDKLIAREALRIGFKILSYG